MLQLKQILNHATHFRVQLAPRSRKMDGREGTMDTHVEFMTLFLRHQAEVKAFIGSLVRDRHGRDDLLQEVALILWEKFPLYDPARSFGAWARGIAAKQVMQRWEKTRRLPMPFAPQTIQA